jgi:lipopolysaccharide export system permease protein
MQVRDKVSRIAPGVFLEAPGADRVFFVEEIAGDQTNVQNVFIAQMKEGRLGITVSRRGYRERAENGDRMVVLLDGRRYEGVPGNLDFKVMNFERYAMRVEAREPQAEETSTKAMSTFGLILAPSNSHLAELLWRIGLPISAFVLALLAIPLSFVNPRASRSVNLLFAIFTYMVYANVLSIVQAWVSSGRVGFNTGWWVVHAGMLGVLGVLFYRRIRVGSLLRMRR